MTSSRCASPGSEGSGPITCPRTSICATRWEACGHDSTLEPAERRLTYRRTFALDEREIGPKALDQLRELLAAKLRSDADTIGLARSDSPMPHRIRMNRRRLARGAAAPPPGDGARWARLGSSSTSVSVTFGRGWQRASDHRAARFGRERSDPDRPPLRSTLRDDETLEEFSAMAYDGHRAGRRVKGLRHRSSSFDHRGHATQRADDALVRAAGCYEQPPQFRSATR